MAVNTTPKAAAPVGTAKTVGTKGAPATTTVAKPTTVKKAGAKAPIDDFIIATANTISNYDAPTALAALKDAIESGGENDFVVGGLLSHIQNTGAWENQGYDSFKLFIEAEHGVQYRKAMYLIEIYVGLTESGVPWEQVAHLGWTKLSKIAKILTPENAEDWIAKAQELNVVQLEEYIKAQKQKLSSGAEGATMSGKEVAGDAAKVTVLTYKVHPDQKDIITAAVEKAQADIGSDYTAVALTHIATSYVESATGKKKVGAPVAAGKQKSLGELLGEATEESKMEVLKQMMTELGVDAVLGFWEECYPEVNISVEM